jgi:hypothetical protein
MQQKNKNLDSGTDVIISREGTRPLRITEADTEKNEPDTYVSATFRLQHCNCTRTLRILKNTSQSDLYLNNDGSSPGPDYWKTTCSLDAVRRGAGQRVVAYSFYGSPQTERHKASGGHVSVNPLPFLALIS